MFGASTKSHHYAQCKAYLSKQQICSSRLKEE